MGQIIAVVSGKGGTGKTAFCANVGVALCARGERVLLIDADAGLRNLDLVLGMQGRLLFTYADVLGGTASLKEASVPHEQVKNLRVLTAPGRVDMGLGGDGLPRLLERCRAHFTYTIIDCPAGLDAGVIALCEQSDRPVVVSTPDAAALRIAQAVGAALVPGAQERCRLVISRAKKRLMRRGLSAGIDQAIDQSGLPLLGVVPEDEDVQTCGNRGEILLLSSMGPAVQAYANIARRLRGERAPLFRGVRGF